MRPWIRRIPTDISPLPQSTISVPIPEVAKPLSDTVIGSLVVKLNRVYQTNLAQRANLEDIIAARQEELRQTNTVIASLEAALTAAADDPALTAEERETAYVAANSRFDGLPLVAEGLIDG